MDRRAALQLIALVLGGCARSRGGQPSGGAPEPWDPVDRSFKGCEGG